jgi:hypothetical protein
MIILVSETAELEYPSEVKSIFFNGQFICYQMQLLSSLALVVEPSMFAVDF